MCDAGGLVGLDDAQTRTCGIDATAMPCALVASTIRWRIAAQMQGDLTAGHGEIDIGQDLGVEQGAVQIAMRVVDGVAFAERVQAVALAGMESARHHERIRHLAQIDDLRRARSPASEFMLEKAQIEWRIVDDELGAFDIAQKGIGDFGKTRLVGEKGVGDAMHRRRTGIDLAIRLDVLMKVIAREPTVDQLDTADLDDPMPLLGIETRGFGIQDDLTHSRHPFIGQTVGALVLGVSGMSLDPAPAHLVPDERGIEPLPQIAVLDRLAVGGSPAIELPARHPVDRRRS